MQCPKIQGLLSDILRFSSPPPLESRSFSSSVSLNPAQFSIPVYFGVSPTFKSARHRLLSSAYSSTVLIVHRFCGGDGFLTVCLYLKLKGTLLLGFVTNVIYGFWFAIHLSVLFLARKIQTLGIYHCFHLSRIFWDILNLDF